MCSMHVCVCMCGHGVYVCVCACMCMCVHACFHVSSIYDYMQVMYCVCIA